MSQLFRLHRHHLVPEPPRGYRACTTELRRTSSTPALFCQVAWHDKLAELAAVENTSKLLPSAAHPVGATNRRLRVELTQLSCLSGPPLDFAKFGYAYVGYLNQGSSSELHLVRKHGATYVAKVLRLDANDPLTLQSYLIELQVLKKVSHPNVVQYVDSFQDEEHCVIIMEFCESGDLFAFLRETRNSQLDESLIRRWVSQICEGLLALRAANILHCDLKTSNLFLDRDMNLKVGDLGLAREAPRGYVSPSRVPKSTPVYMSPEMCARKSVTGAADCWSLGCIIFELCRNEHAFPRLHSADCSSLVCDGYYDNLSAVTVGTALRHHVPLTVTLKTKRMLSALAADFSTLQQIITSQNGQLLPEVYSKELNFIVVSLLQINPERRLSLREVSRLLQNEVPRVA